MKKSFVLLILCFALTNGFYSISAQSRNQVLVTGKQSLKQSDINSLIEFYEWAFIAQFTNEQRDKFREYTVAEFRNDPSGSRATINDIINSFPNICAASEDVQQETREKFLEVFLREARRNSDDNSKMLIGIYESAHNDGAASQSNMAENQTNDSNNNLTESEKSVLAEMSVGEIGNLSNITGTWV